ncbi:hypothetical protein CHARACLAT_006801 [Characodon lateralis]|uniref:Uncharacterized protein n=1 Tax=Characodon lateralis TaxID=208331 RepID=A0ABU7F0R6_9TELE|nr:hypothetical protein [Characodon lateralis]
MLEDEAFGFFLVLFHKLMPHVGMLYNQLLKRNIDSVNISGSIQRFINIQQAIREAVPSLVEGEKYRDHFRSHPQRNGGYWEKTGNSIWHWRYVTPLFVMPRRDFHSPSTWSGPLCCKEIYSHNTTRSSQIQHWIPELKPIPHRTRPNLKQSCP